MTHRALILGGGITGLTAAWRAANAGLEPVVFEASTRTGGMGSSIHREGFVLDHGIHGLYSARDETRALIEEMVELFGHDFLTISKKTSIHFRGRYLKYPMGVKELFRALPLLTSAACIFDFVLTRIRGRFRDIGVAESFETWVSDRFGHRLYEIYFGPYVEKVWGVSGPNMSSAWLARRISTISIVSVIMRALKSIFSRRVPDEMHSLQPQTFLYPPKGSGQFVDRVRDAALEKKALFMYETRVVGIQRVDDLWEVEVEDSNGIRIERGNVLISSLPISLLIRLLGNVVPKLVQEASADLHFRSMVIVNLFINQPRVYGDQWVYYSSPDLPFNRINEFTNLAEGFSPEGKTALNCEITCFRGDDVWNRSDEALKEWCVDSLTGLGILDPVDVFDYSVVKLPNAYPIFSIGVEPRLEKVLSYIDSCPLLYTAGRQGRFEYINMDECIWHASNAVQEACRQLGISNISRGGRA